MGPKKFISFFIPSKIEFISPFPFLSFISLFSFRGPIVGGDGTSQLPPEPLLPRALEYRPVAPEKMTANLEAELGHAGWKGTFSDEVEKPGGGFHGSTLP